MFLFSYMLDEISTMRTHSVMRHLDEVRSPPVVTQIGDIAFMCKSEC